MVEADFLRQKFDDICYHGSAANDMGCDWNQGGG